MDLKITAIVLAAGQSRRMGRQKLLLPWNGKTVIRHIVDELAASAVDRIVVVTGSDHEAVVESLRGAGVETVSNPNVQEGMLSSVRCGVERVETEAAAFMVVLGDQPSLSCELVNGLCGFWRLQPDTMVRPEFGNTRGHPLIIPTEYRELVLTCFDDIGLKGLLRRFPDLVREWRVDDPGVVEDIDTPDDYARELTRWEERE